jgi:hypothetical protein
MGGPQGIVCEPDAVTGVYYVTQLEFGFISPITSTGATHIREPPRRCRSKHYML